MNGRLRRGVLVAWILTLVAAPEGRTAGGRSAASMPVAVTGPIPGTGSSSGVTERGGFGDDFASAHDALRDAWIEELAAFAAWCHEQHLFAERDRIWQLVIELAPDHVAAHEGLGHKLVKKDSSWKVPSKPRKVKDSPKALPQLAERRPQAVRTYRDGVLALLESAGESLSASDRSEILDRILEVSPDDPEVHHLLGEERYRQGWVLAETARAYDRRPELRRYVADAIQEAGSPSVLRSIEARDELGVQFLANAETPGVRVLGTVPLEETLRAAQACEAARTVFQRVFESRTRFHDDFTIYLILDESDKNAFLAALPGLSDDEREFLKLLVGTGVPRTANVVQWDPDPSRRIDGAVRHAIGMLLRQEFELTTEHAWAWEGVGLYLTRELVGSRLTWYIQAADRGDLEAAKLRADLLVQTGNWMNAAYQLLKQPGAPRIDAVMALDVNTMGVKEMLVAYALCAFLMEGRPQALTELLYRAGRGQEPARSIEGTLDMDVDALHARLVRWLSERRRPTYWDRHRSAP